MRWQGTMLVAFAAIMAGTGTPAQAQGVGKYFAPKDQVIAIRAGRLFNSASGSSVSEVSNSAAMACVTDPWKNVETIRFNAERLAACRETRGR